MSCNGNCGSCSGCARELVLTRKEIDFLNLLGQYAFLPVARSMGDLTPVYLETGDREEMGLVLQCLVAVSAVCTPGLLGSPAKSGRKIEICAYRRNQR